MKITIVSGKGGTGKTTIASSLAYLVDQTFAKADCDVDASNLDIILKGKTFNSKPFIGAKMASINQDQCISCGDCKKVCRYNAIHVINDVYTVKPLKCEGCNACVVKCPVNAIDLNDEVIGDIEEKTFDNGTLVTSNMMPGAEGSGKLVHEVRETAAKYNKNDMLIDGSPGTSCAVMSSITDTDYAIIITEPTQSGLEDLVRIQEVVRHFKVYPFIIINKADINEEMADIITQKATELSIDVIGRIPFDETANKAINTLTPLIEYKDSKAAKAIETIWTDLKSKMEQLESEKTLFKL